MKRRVVDVDDEVESPKKQTKSKNTVQKTNRIASKKTKRKKEIESDVEDSGEDSDSYEKKRKKAVMKKKNNKRSGAKRKLALKDDSEVEDSWEDSDSYDNKRKKVVMRKKTNKRSGAKSKLARKDDSEFEDSWESSDSCDNKSKKAVMRKKNTRWSGAKRKLAHIDDSEFEDSWEDSDSCDNKSKKAVMRKKNTRRSGAKRKLAHKDDSEFEDSWEDSDSCDNKSKKVVTRKKNTRRSGAKRKLAHKDDSEVEDSWEDSVSNDNMKKNLVKKKNNNKRSGAKRKLDQDDSEAEDSIEVRGTSGKKNYKGKEERVSKGEKSGLGRKKEAMKGKNKEKNWFKMKSRTSPKQLFNVIPLLKDKQREAVKKLGFGKLLYFKVEEIPGKMGHYVVENFNRKKMEIRLKNRVVKVDCEAVHNMIGIPSSGIDLLKIVPFGNLEPAIKRWRDLYPNRLINPSDIAARIEESEDDDGFLFQLDFIMLFLSTMVEIQKHGKCKTDILYRFSNNTKFSEFNWCAYVVDKIRTCKEGWEKSNLNFVFTGPLTIMTLLYVHNVACQGVQVDRGMRAVSFWTAKMLKAREKWEITNGGFGLGELKGVTADEVFSEKDIEVNLEVEVKRITEMLEWLVHDKNLTEKTLRRVYKKNPERGEIIKLVERYESLLDVKPKWSELGEAENEKKVKEIESQTMTEKDGAENVTEKVTITISDDDTKNGEKDKAEDEGSVMEKVNKDSADECNKSDNEKGCVKNVEDRSNKPFLGYAKDDTYQDCSPGSKLEGSGENNMEVDISGILDYYSVTEEEKKNEDIIYEAAWNDRIEKEMEPNEEDGAKRKNPCRTMVLSSTLKSPYIVSEAEINKWAHINENCQKISLAKEKNEKEQRVEAVEDVEEQGNLNIESLEVNEKTLLDKEKKGKKQIDEQVKDVNKEQKVIKKEEQEKTVNVILNEEEAILEDEEKSLQFDMDFETAYGVASEDFVFKSLKCGRQIFSSVIDCWVAVLNHEEENRSKDSPHRLFCPTTTIVTWMLEGKEVEDKDRIDALEKNMLAAVSGEKKVVDMKNYDLVFFPIQENKHVYLVIFDLKNPAISVIDNMQEEVSLVGVKDDVEYLKKDTPYKVKYLFEKYLAKFGHPKAEEIAAAKVEQVKISWATKENMTDSEVFVMRHMEVFKGVHGTFNCGLSNNESRSKNQLNILRKIYAARILLSAVNIQRD